MFSASAVVSVVLRPFPTLRKFHLIQETADRLVLQAVFLEPPTAEILAYMQRRMFEYLGSGVKLDIAVVDSIDEERARKFGSFTSRLPNPISSIAGADTQR